MKCFIIAILSVTAAGCCSTRSQMPEERKFNKALSLQEAAAADTARGDDATAQKNLAQAASDYRLILKMKPSSAATLNNLALIEAEMGDVSSAISHLESAVQADDENRLMYVRNLADLYATSGSWREAASRYYHILRIYPAERDIQTKLVALYATYAAAEVNDYLAFAETVPPDIATEMSQRVLQNPGLQSAHEKAVIELARALALRIPIEPMDRLREEVTPNSCPLDAACGPLLRVVLGERLDRALFSWWLTRPATTAIAARRAFAAVLSSAGTRAAIEGLPSANKYFQDAMEVTDLADLGPAAALVDFYIGQRWPIEFLDSLVSVIARRPPAVDVAAYDYHRTAAVAYSRFGRWYDCNAPERSVMFHISQARQLAAEILPQSDPALDILSDEAPPPPDCPPTLPPTVANPKLDEQLKDPNVPQIGTISGKILFGFDSHSLAEDKCRRQLMETAEALKKDLTLRVVVHGHTDDIGSEAYNYRLSIFRAEAVRHCLSRTLDIDSSRILAVGFGETDPVVQNNSRSNRVENRRAEWVLQH